MAKRVDTTKIESIKAATIKVVVERGIAGASIALIAKEAKVSDGYLYRFYKGKRELLSGLFVERFEETQELLDELLKANKTVAGIVDKFTRKMYETAINNSNLISFYYKLLSDFSFDIPESCKVNMMQICERIVKLGKATGEIDDKFTSERFYTLTVGYILQSINIRLREIFQKKQFTEEEITQNIEWTLRAMKPQNDK